MDLSDIQGLVFHSYRRLPHASYVLLRFGTSPQAAQRWLAEFVDQDRIDCALPKEIGPPGSPQSRVNIALTYTGLVALGLDAGALATFPLEFVEGLGAPWRHADDPDHRSRILGDLGDSRPAQWEWGYQDEDRQVDAMLLAFSKDSVALDRQVAEWIRQGEASCALRPGRSRTLWGEFPKDPNKPNREPFGFVDGISQPILKGAAGRLRQTGRPRQPALQEIDDGELLMGHRDGSRQIARSPTVDASCCRARQLPASPDGGDRRDLGRNGTYLVFRQLLQDVKGFDEACAMSAPALGLQPDHVAALVVGRWKNGSPLVSAPIEHDAVLAAAPAANDFTYGGDPHGERCPMGAHVRRANPRDSLGDDPATSLQVANRHRILRRGRPYTVGHQRGLHFIGLNASISRQFEFVQQNWINSTIFGGLLDQDDPLIGSHQARAGDGGQTLPPPPEDRIARRLSGLHRYVTVVGGGYFFLPSLTALRFLSHAAPPPERPAPRRPMPQAVTTADRVRALVLARFSILSALVLAAAPLGILSPAASAIVRPTFELDRPWEMLAVAALASLAAAGAHLTYRIVQLYARARFNVGSIVAPLTWRMVFTWQALSVPTVATALWLSAKDAASVLPSPMRWTEVLWFAGAALGGYLLSFTLMYAAAAARAASVRGDNPEDSLLVPLNARLERLKGRRSIIAWMARPIVDFFESRAAMLREGAGAGYVDRETVRILPGHLTVLMLVLTLFLFYAVGFIVLRPPTNLQLPPLAYFLFVVLAIGLATSSAAFFLDKFRVPLATIILAWFVFATFIGGTDHEFALQKEELNRPASVGESIVRSDAFYRASTGMDSSTRPVIVVAAGGGGIRQAAWTAQVLAGLTNLWGAEFSGNVQLVSAVSAGSVGALHFLKGYSGKGPPTDDLQRGVRASEASASGDIWWGLTYPDSLRALFTFPIRPLTRTMDRGWALEAAWQQTLEFDSSETLNKWRTDVFNGWRPGVAFNATVVETGKRAVLATYDVPDATTADDAGVIACDRDLLMVTAARLSAAFPYVSPVARPTGGACSTRGHLADGGYWDNSGVVSALEWLQEAAGILQQRDVLVIEIAPAVPDQPPIADRAWVWQLTAPLSGLLSVRTDGQRARKQFEREALRDTWRFWQGQQAGADTRTGHIEFVTIADVPAGKPVKGAKGEVKTSLGWHLSRQERCNIERQWQKRVEDPHDAALSKIESILKARRAGVPDVSIGCGR